MNKQIRLIIVGSLMFLGLHSVANVSEYANNPVSSAEIERVPVRITISTLLNILIPASNISVTNLNTNQTGTLAASGNSTDIYIGAGDTLEIDVNLGITTISLLADVDDFLTLIPQDQILDINVSFLPNE